MSARLILLAVVLGACAKSAPVESTVSADQVAVPVPGPPAVAPAPDPVRTELTNGVPVYTVAAPSLPLVSVRLMLPTGSIDDPADRQGLAALTTRMLSESAGSRSAIEQAAALDALAADLDFSVGRESLILQLDVHRDALADALPLAADALLRPAWSPDDFARVESQHISSVQAALDNNSVVAGRVADAQWWGPEHPYGRPHDGTVASASDTLITHLKAWHTEHIHAGGAAFVVVGAVEPDQATELLDAHFGSMPATARSKRELAAPVATEGVAIVDRPGSSQTVISVVLPGEGANDPQRAPIDAVQTILGGSFTSRLNRRLREELGYTYGARMSVTRYRHGGVISVRVSVRADATADALVELLALLRAAQTDGVTAAEAARGRAQLITSAVDSSETRAGLAEVLVAELASGHTPDALGAYLQQVDALEAKSVSRAASTVRTGAASIVLVGDRAEIEGELVGRGFTELGAAEPLGLTP